MFLILDTSALLSGKISSIPAGFDRVFITSLVRGEVTKGTPSRLLENLLEIGLEIRDPVQIQDAEKVARSTGDLERLSETDISVIALAEEIKDSLVLTDDFRVQNVLRKLGLRYQPSGEIGDRSIKDIWEWTYRCKGCGRFFDEAQKKDDCPICGSFVRKVRKKR